MKYSEWLKKWIDDYVKPYRKQRTVERYSEMVRLYLAPMLGEMEMDEISRDVLQEFVIYLLNKGNTKTGKGLATNSVNGIISVLKASIGVAHSLGISKTDPTEKIRRPKSKEKRVECFTEREQKTLELNLINSHKTKMKGILICLYTGIRIGELLALEWRDIDLEKGFLIINKSCHYGMGDDGRYRRFTEEPKTDSSIRIIPIPRELLSIIKSMKRLAKTQYVIEENGKNVSVRSYQKTFELLLKKCNLPKKGFHSLRHTFATRAIECGVDVRTLAEILGHKDPSVTLKRYAHSLMEHKIEMMNKVGKLLKKAQ